MFKKDYFLYYKLLPFLIVVFILFKLVNNLDIIIYIFNTCTKILDPLLWGLIIAFFINPFMKNLEKKLKINRILSLTFSYVIVFSLIYFLITVIYPRLAATISDILTNIPNFIDNIKFNFDKIVSKNDFIGKDIIITYVNNKSLDFISSYEANVNTYLSILFGYIYQISYNIFQIIFGFIISIYILKDKEKMTGYLKKFTIAIFNKKISSFLIELCYEANIIFTQFLVGKLIDSTIIGIICFIGLVIFNFKYALLISIIIGTTNMIPYFGPLFGITPAVIITSFDNPTRAIWIGIFTFILLQFDGLYLGPKILSNKVGLSPFLVILAIIIGGGLFGILGVFFGVPTFAVIKSFLEKYVDKRLEVKNKIKAPN